MNADVPNRQLPNDSPHREVCYRCHKPQRVCICALIKPVANATGITILQHPNERFHPIGTARIAKLGLDNVDLRVVWNGFHADPDLPSRLPPNAGLLFPDPNARDLAELSPEERPENLVVIDGTWSTARNVYRSNPCLHALPHYQLTPDAPSQYLIRKEPKAEYRSTIEAIWQALRILEPENTSLGRLMDAFNAMIKQQIEFEFGPEQKRRPKRSNPRLPKAIPPIFRSHFDTIVVGYGEFFTPTGNPEDSQLLYWAAVRPATGESFAAALRPAGAISDWMPPPFYFNKMGISPEKFENGLTLEEFKTQWKAFFCPGDTLTAWNHITLRSFEKWVAQPNAPLSLKAIYCNHIGGRSGDLEQVLEREDLRPLATNAEGRCGFRLGHAASIAKFFHCVVPEVKS